MQPLASDSSWPAAGNPQTYPFTWPLHSPTRLACLGVLSRHWARPQSLLCLSIQDRQGHEFSRDRQFLIGLATPDLTQESAPNRHVMRHWINKSAW